jgi:crotonobetainyl-CoA:carnitine CoA-transferase CaiB-like acyl-CoA transferase
MNIADMNKPIDAGDEDAGAAEAPLAGVTVVEFCSVAAGPFCGMLLADMGATVIKVEPHAGDALRQWPPLNDGFSENFLSLNRNKHSIALDLKDPADNAIAVQLIEGADVVIENSRPGVMDRLGLGYHRFAAAYPSMVYCSMSAFGQTGPRAAEGGFDVTLQAMSGIMSVTGEPDGGPVKCGVPISDFATGLYAAFSVASLVARVRGGGGGGFIDISMLGASLAIAALQTSEYFGSGRDPRRLGAAHPRNAPYQAFRASDNHFVIAAGNDKLWHSVCQVLDLPHLKDDPRFKTTSDRAANQVALADILNEVFARDTAKAWLARFAEAGVPCAPINTYSQILSDVQTEAMGWVQDIELPNGARTRTFGSPLRIDGQWPAIRRTAPALDADRVEILEMLKSFPARADAAE